MNREPGYTDRSRTLAPGRGYTLTEMLVVLAIIALMAAIVVPQLALQQEGTGLKSAATELMSSLRAVRRIAIADRYYRALALNLHSIPGEFVIMRPRLTTESTNLPLWIPISEPRQLPDNVAIVGVAENFSWNYLDITRSDDRDLDGTEEDTSANQRIYNPGNLNNRTNGIYRLIRFYPTGTADPAMIYLWNTTEERREIPNPSTNLSAANIPALGVPPGMNINAMNDQMNFFSVPTENSEADIYYYTLVVNQLTGSVEVHDYAWGYGTPQWDRKKDGS